LFEMTSTASSLSIAWSPASLTTTNMMRTKKHSQLEGLN
jgi:hypothetical protein